MCEADLIPLDELDVWVANMPDNGDRELRINITQEGSDDGAAW